MWTLEQAQPDVKTYEYFLNCFAKGDVQQANELYAEMEAKGIAPSANANNNVLRAYANAHKIDEAPLEKLTSKKDRITEDIILRGYALLGRTEEVQRLFRERTSKRTDYTLNQLLTCFAVNLNVDGMLEALEDCEQQYELVPNCLGISILVQLLTRLGRMAEAEAEVDNLKNPDRVVLASLLGAYAKRGNIAKVEELYVRISPRDRNEEVMAAYLQAYLKVANEEKASYILDSSFSQRTCHMWLRHFAKLGDVERCTSVVEKMKVRQVRATDSTYGWLFTVYANANDFDRARKLFDSLPKSGLTYHNMISLYTRLKRFEDAARLLEEMRNNQMVVRVGTVHLLMNGHAQEGNTAQVEKFFAQIRHEAILKSYCILIHGYVVAKDLVHAEEAMLDLKKHFKPNTVAYNALMTGYVAMGQVSKAEEKLRESPNPSCSSYTILMQGYCRANRMKKVEALLVEMQQRNFAPDAYIYTTMIKGYSQLQKHAQARKIKQKMESQSIPLTNASWLCLMLGHSNVDRVKEVWQDALDAKVTPDAAMYTAYLHTCIEHGEAKDCKEVEDLAPPHVKRDDRFSALVLRTAQTVEQLDEKWMHYLSTNATPSLVLWNMRVEVLVRLGDLDRANRAMNELLSRTELVPDATTFVWRLKCQESYDRRFEIWQELEEQKIEPTPKMYTCMIDASMGNYERAKYWMEDMRERGLIPDATAYGKYIAAATRDPAVKKAQLASRATEIFNEMTAADIEPGVFVLNCYMCPFADMGDVKQTEDIFESLNTQQITPNIVTFSTLMLAHARNEDTEGVKRVLKQVYDANLKPNIFIYTVRMVCSHKKSLPETRAIFDELCQTDVKPNISSINTLILAHAYARDLEGISHKLELCEKHGLEPNAFTFFAGMLAYFKAGDMAGVLQEYEEIKSRNLDTSEIRIIDNLVAHAQNGSYSALKPLQTSA